MAVITNGLDKIIDIVQKFIQVSENSGVTIERAIIFGSYVRGDYNEWSDIDLAVVSPDFTGIPFYDRQILVPFILKVDTRIELHPFRSDEFLTDNFFINEIVKNGLEIAI